MRVAATVCWLALTGAGQAETIVAAEYTEPTSRYAHGVLGDTIEHAGLRVTLESGETRDVFWPDTLVFEDTAPRLVDMDLDGAPEVITVESHEYFGARLAIWGLDANNALVAKATTEFIGAPYRWLAVAGAADLDGDGYVEIAYIDRPHLTKILTIYRYLPQPDGSAQLSLVGTKPDLTNHRIGERDIGGGIRSCDGTIEVITASGDWTRIMATSLENDTLTTRDTGPHFGRASLDNALSCAS